MNTTVTSSSFSFIDEENIPKRKKPNVLFKVGKTFYLN